MAVLDVVDLKKSFRSPGGEVSPIVDVARFTLEPGQQAALAGASGSGKTTFLHLLAGILEPDAGRVIVAGHEITALREPARDRIRGQHVGYVFQTFNLLQGYTALENVLLAMRFGRGADLAVATELLRRVGLAAKLHHRPRELSVGQQQRVAVARALANRPELVLADEPTGNLDHRHAREALALIREVCAEAGAALLLVSHDRELLASFGQVVDLEDVNTAGRGESAEVPGDGGRR